MGWRGEKEGELVRKRCQVSKSNCTRFGGQRARRRSHAPAGMCPGMRGAASTVAGSPPSWGSDVSQLRVLRGRGRLGVPWRQPLAQPPYSPVCNLTRSETCPQGGRINTAVFPVLFRPGMALGDSAAW